MKCRKTVRRKRSRSKKRARPLLPRVKGSDQSTLIDGASWIRTQLTERPDLLPLDGRSLDFCHLAENVHRFRRAVFGDEDDGGWA